MMLLITFVRLATPLPYFISELLCVSRGDLQNVTTIPLDVVTLHPLLQSSPHPFPTPSQSVDYDCRVSRGLTDLQPSAARVIRSSSPTDLTTGTRSRNHHHHHEQHVSFCPPAKKVKLSSVPTEIVLSALENTGGIGPWILDIDLDFFSTGNPFRSIYSNVRRKNDVYIIVLVIVLATLERKVLFHAYSVGCVGIIIVLIYTYSTPHISLTPYFKMVDDKTEKKAHISAKSHIGSFLAT